MSCRPSRMLPSRAVTSEKATRQATGGPDLGVVLLDQQVGARPVRPQHGRHHLGGDPPGVASVARESSRVLKARVASRTGGSFRESTSTSSISPTAGDAGLQSLEPRREPRDRRGVEGAVLRTQRAAAGRSRRCPARPAARCGRSSRARSPPRGRRGRRRRSRARAGGRPQQVVRVAVGHAAWCERSCSVARAPVTSSREHLPRQHADVVLARCSASAVRVAW